MKEFDWKTISADLLSCGNFKIFASPHLCQFHFVPIKGDFKFGFESFLKICLILWKPNTIHKFLVAGFVFLMKEIFENREIKYTL